MTNKPDTYSDNNKQAAMLEEAPTINIWLMLALIVITLGIYSIYWIYSRSQWINKTFTSQLINSAFIHTVLACTIINISMSFVVMLLDVNTGYIKAVSSFNKAELVLSLVANLLFIVWVFMFRNVINQLTQAQPGDVKWCHWLWTLLFNVLYMQYKLNKIKTNKYLLI